jgi:hypothetical protein
MRLWRVTVLVARGCLLLAGRVVADEADPTAPPARRAEVVALALAQDARFAGLPDPDS